MHSDIAAPTGRYGISGRSPGSRRGGTRHRAAHHQGVGLIGEQLVPERDAHLFVFLERFHGLADYDDLIGGVRVYFAALQLRTRPASGSATATTRASMSFSLRCACERLLCRHAADDPDALAREVVIVAIAFFSLRRSWPVTKVISVKSTRSWRPNVMVVAAHRCRPFRRRRRRSGCRRQRRVRHFHVGELEVLPDSDRDSPTDVDRIPLGVTPFSNDSGRESGRNRAKLAPLLDVAPAFPAPAADRARYERACPTEPPTGSALICSFVVLLGRLGRAHVI